MESKQYLTLRNLAAPPSYEENTTSAKFGFLQQHSSLPGRQDPGGEGIVGTDSPGPLPGAVVEKEERAEWKARQSTLPNIIICIILLTLTTNQCVFEIYKWRHRGSQKLRYLAISTTKWQSRNLLKIARSAQRIQSRPPYMSVSVPFPAKFVVTVSSSLSNLFITCRPSCICAWHPVHTLWILGEMD